MLTGNAQPTDLVRRKAPQVVSALSGVPRAKASRRTVQGPSRGTFDRGDLKEVAGSIRYGATINFLCNESLAVGLRSLHETNSALRYVATRPEDITPALAVAGGHFVQVLLGEACHPAKPAGYILANAFPSQQPLRLVCATWPPNRNQGTPSDHPLSVSNNDLGSCDCRTMLNSVPRPTGSWSGTGTVIVVVSKRFCMI